MGPQMRVGGRQLDMEWADMDLPGDIEHYIVPMVASSGFQLEISEMEWICPTSFQIL